MAATVATTPPTPASCYRPLPYRVVRTDPAGTLIVEVFIADSSAVSALGNGVVVGDVIVAYAGSVFGTDPVVAGQAILMDPDCGSYAGRQMTLNAFTVSSMHYIVIDATPAGDFTPASGLGSFRVLLDNHEIHLKVLVYTDPEGTPHEVLMRAKTGAGNSVSFDVGLRIRDYFNDRIDDFVKPIPGGSLAQDAHGVTALFYRVHIAEVYDVPSSGAVDPYDGEHDLLVDDVEDLSTFKVAVNAIHPFAGETVDWTDTDLSIFVVGGDTFERKFLSDVPRATVGEYIGHKVTLAASDHFRVHMLTDSALDFEVDYTLRVYDVSGSTSSFVGAITASLPDTTTSAVSFAVGPADLSPHLTVPSKYRIYVSNEEEDALSQGLEITVDAGCKENRRKFGFLNKLGGVDLYTFTGRESSMSKTKRAVVKKPYGTGSGYDYRTRTYRAEPERTRTASTAPINAAMSRWLAEGMTESVNVVVIENDIVCPAIVLTNDVFTHTTGPWNKPITIEYALGVDNLSQQN